MADEPTEIDNGAGGDDVGWWNCSLCTYKNAADKFKCEICDLRRGTSTRKPRCSKDTIVAQVVKQQEQIRQQTRAKPSPKNKTGTSTPTLGASHQQMPSDNSRGSKKSGGSRNPKPSVTHDVNVKKAARATNNNDLEQSSESGESSESEGSDDNQDSPSESQETSVRSKSSAKRRKQTASSSNRKPQVSKKTRTVRISNDNSRSDTDSEDDDDDGDDDVDSDSTSVASDALPEGQSPRIHGPGSESSMDDRSPYSSSSAMTPEPTTSSPNHSASMGGKQHPKENPFKNRPIEINGNLIKYAPPTSTGRTGLIIDKKKFTQHSVTVNDVTITFTEFATRQNLYVRKKKKRSRTRTAPATANSVEEAD